MPNTFSPTHAARLSRAKPVRIRTKLDWAIIASILLMLAVNAVALFGDLGPTTAYAAVPM